jgi:hypothetical protein
VKQVIFGTGGKGRVVGEVRGLLERARTGQPAG